jgi:hypothetical protein
MLGAQLAQVDSDNIMFGWLGQVGDDLVQHVPKSNAQQKKYLTT